MGLSTSRDDVTSVPTASAAYSAYARSAFSPPRSSSSALALGAPPSPIAKRARASRAAFGAPPDAKPQADAEDPDVVPVVVEWRYGGASVSIAGAWDGWTKSIELCSDGGRGGSSGRGAGFIAVVYLPPGKYQFKYLVDGNWQCSPGVETERDADSNMNNVLRVSSGRGEFDVPEEEEPVRSEPGSPLESYDGSCLTAEMARASPPVLPDAAAPRVEEPGVKCYALVNHLSLAGSLDDRGTPRPITDEPVYMGATFRHKSKLISATYITPSGVGGVGGDSAAGASGRVHESDVFRRGNAGRGRGAPPGSRTSAGVEAALPHLAL